MRPGYRDRPAHPSLYVVHRAALRSSRAGRERPRVVACARLGGSSGEVAPEAIAPGVRTPAPSHAGEPMALVLEGAGKLVIDGGGQRFHAPYRLLGPPSVDFKLVDAGLAELRLVRVYTRAPEPAPSGEPVAPSVDAARAADS